MPPGSSRNALNQVAQQVVSPQVLSSHLKDESAPEDDNEFQNLSVSMEHPEEGISNKNINKLVQKPNMISLLDLRNGNPPIQDWTRFQEFYDSQSAKASFAESGSQGALSQGFVRLGGDSDSEDGGERDAEEGENATGGGLVEITQEELQQAIQIHQLEQNSLDDPEGGVGQTNYFSDSSEWSNLLQNIQGIFQRESSIRSDLQMVPLYHQVYENILDTRERAWHEEAAALYQERGGGWSLPASQINFDRRVVQLQEQFRWLVAAVASYLVNRSCKGIQSASEFAQKNSAKRAATRARGSVQSQSFQAQNLGIGSDLVGEDLTPLNVSFPQAHRYCVAHEKDLRAVPTRSGYPILVRAVPDPTHALWGTGFIWKGVLWRLYTGSAARRAVKREFRALKHAQLELEQFQSSATLQRPGGAPPRPLSLIPPVQAYAEYPTWVLLGRAVVVVPGPSVPSPLLSGSEERLLARLFPQNQTLSRIENSLLRQLPEPGGAAASVFVLDGRGGRLVEQHAPYRLYFVVPQDQRANVTYFPHHKDSLEIAAIQKLLDYQGFDID